MTNEIAIRRPGVGTTKAAFAIILKAWRTLRPHHFGYAALAGLAIGTVQWASNVLYAGMLEWDGLAVTIGFWIVLAEMLLLALAVAAGVTTTRMPKWLPFVLAAIVVTSIGTGLAIGISRYLAGTEAAAAPTARPLLADIWITFYTTLLLLGLASLGYMRALDGWKRANALRDLQFEKTRLSRKAYEARLQALQARLDPRFLFETLSSIETTYAADHARGQRVMDDLIAYLRAALPALDDPASSLQAEMTLVRTWLAIKHIRYGDRLSFSLTGPGPSQDARMPPMVLQPLVQYAVESIVDAAYDRPSIAIAAHLDETRVRIAITVSGPTFATAIKTVETTAIRERLDALFGADASLVFRWVDSDHSRADLEIPNSAPGRPRREYRNTVNEGDPRHPRGPRS